MSRKNASRSRNARRAAEAEERKDDAPEAANDSAPEAEIDSGDAAALLEGAEARIVALTEEAGDLKDRLLRSVAEMENLRKRTEREVRDARNYAIANFARDMLTATDNLGRALEVLPEDEREGAEGTLKALIEGVTMTEHEMLRLLEKHGITKLAPMGEKFDPNFHQAMYELPDESLVDGTVAQVMQEGYVIGERVLRPAMVAVARGGPKAPKVQKADEDDSAEEAEGTGPGGDADDERPEKVDKTV